MISTALYLENQGKGEPDFEAIEETENAELQGQN